MGICYSSELVSLKSSYTQEEINNIPTFAKYFTKDIDGYICSIYDGDTCTAIIPIGCKLVKISIRMNGYDCPEMKPSKSNLDRDFEIKFAKLAKEKLSSLVLNKRILIKANGLDKYGRLLANLNINDNNVNEYMLTHRYGYMYSGKTKAETAYFENYYLVNNTKMVIIK